MKKKLSALVSFVFILTLLTGCGESIKNEAASPTVSSLAEEAQTSEPTPVEEESPYNFAKGKFEVNDKGYPTGPYEYELPLTTSDEVLSFWTVVWTPQYLPEGGYPDMPFPLEMEKRTGVNIEYVVIAPESRAENFSVLLAADDLCDISAGANYFYGSNFKNAVTEEGYFINIHDYMDYCPNYIWEATKDAEDDDTYYGIFEEEDLITTFYLLKDKGYYQLDYFARGDWMEKLGLTNDDIKTFDQLHDMLTLCKTNIDTCTYPMTLYSTLEIPGSNSWNAFDTFCCVSGLGLVYVVDGKVRHANMNENDYKLMTMITEWYNEGLIDPNWSAFNNNTDMPGSMVDGGQLAYFMMSANGAQEHEAFVDQNASVGWVPVTKPLLYEGQTLHLGGDTKRIFYGSASVSTKCENIPLAVTWIDYRYSPDGAILGSYGVEGVFWEWDENGERAITEYAYKHELNLTFLAALHCFNNIAEPGLEIQYARYHFPGGDRAIYAHEYWASYSYDGAYSWPVGAKLTTEQTNEINRLSGDINTYLSENYTQFVDGSKPLSEWNSYVNGLIELGINDALSIYQKAYDDYMAREKE